MNELRIVYLGALVSLGAAFMLACSGDASLGSHTFQQGSEKDSSNDGSASSGSGDGAAATSDGTPSGTSGDVQSAASSGTGSGTTTGGEPSGSGTGGTSGSGGASASSGAATTDSGTGGTGNAAGTGGTASSSTDGGSNCEEVPCLRPYECVEYCGGPLLSSSCCPCAEGLIDSFIECRNTCTDGATMDDGCNTCSCSGGAWVCTTRACPEVTYCGARAGDTCGPDEYCAYVEGQYCGAADAQATCQPRPEGCVTIYSPVCGCDGKTYGNACDAAAAGTGVDSSGPCEASP